MKILQVSFSDSFGGAAKIAASLFSAYRSRGHTSWMAVGSKNSIDPDVFVIPRWSRRVSFPYLIGRINRWLDDSQERMKGAWRLRQWTKKIENFLPEVKQQLGKEDFSFPGCRTLLSLPPEKPDIIHLHNLHGGYFDLRILPELSATIPVVITLHDEWMLTGHCAYSLDCLRWQTGCGACPYLDSYPALIHDGTAFNWRRKRRIYERSRLNVVTPSKWLMQRVESSMLSTVGRRVIPNGVDQTIFLPGDQVEARKALDLPQGVRIVLFAALFAKTNNYKDYQTIESAIHFLSTQTDREILCICLGERADGVQSGKVRIQFVDYEKIPERVAMYYQAADVFVHAAKADTFPTTILEAMACGIPTVATAIGGVYEQVVHGSTGFQVGMGDGRMMAKYIDILLKDRALATQMGMDAYRQAKACYGLEHQVDTTLCYYEEILGNYKMPRSYRPSL